MPSSLSLGLGLGRAARNGPSNPSIFTLFDVEGFYLSFKNPLLVLSNGNPAVDNALVDEVVPVAGDHGAPIIAAGGDRPMFRMEPQNRVHFDGSDRMDTTVSFTGAATIAMTVRFTSNFGVDGRLAMSAGTTGSLISLGIGSDNKVAFSWGDFTASYGAEILDDAIHTIVLAGDGTSQQLYLDGVEVASTTVATAVSGSAISIGGDLTNDPTGLLNLQGSAYSAFFIQRKLTLAEINNTLIPAMERTF